MIKIDKGTIKLEGDIDMILNELTFGINHIIHFISTTKNSNTTYDELLETILDGMKPYRLIDAGMDPMEALDVVDMTDKINIENSDLYPEQNKTGEE